jgi:hypothetical protein
MSCNYRRPVIKIKATQALACASAPAGVLEGSRADVSFIAGLLLDKFAYHLPLYRQHQRLADAGITVSRPWLTQIAQQGIGLLAPIYDAQFDSMPSTSENSQTMRTCSGSSSKTSLKWTKSTCACSLGAISKRSSNAGAGCGRTLRTKSPSTVSPPE